MRFRGEIAVVIKSFYRTTLDGRFIRIHQQDMCQSHALPPTKKYENKGGPGARAIVALLRTQSSRPEEDIPSSTDAIIFNCLIAGTAAHAKNYSVLIGAV